RRGTKAHRCTLERCVEPAQRCGDDDDDQRQREHGMGEDQPSETVDQMQRREQEIECDRRDDGRYDQRREQRAVHGLLEREIRADETKGGSGTERRCQCAYDTRDFCAQNRGVHPPAPAEFGGRGWVDATILSAEVACVVSALATTLGTAAAFGLVRSERGEGRAA